MTNAFNFIDSSDGLSVGLSGLSVNFSSYCNVKWTRTNYLFLRYSFRLCIGLYFLIHIQQSCLGDSGAQTLGFILGAIAIVYNPSTDFNLFMVLPIMIFYVPLFDLARLFFKNKKKETHSSSIKTTPIIVYQNEAYP